MKESLFKLLVLAFVVVMVKLVWTTAPEMITVLTCLVVFIVVVMMKLK